MEQQIGRLAHQFGLVSGKGCDHRFGRFLAQLLRDLFDALGMEVRDIACLRRGIAARGNRGFEAGESVHARLVLQTPRAGKPAARSALCASAMVCWPKWKMLAASTALAWPSRTPATR